MNVTASNRYDPTYDDLALVRAASELLGYPAGHYVELKHGFYADRRGDFRLGYPMHPDVYIRVAEAIEQSKREFRPRLLPEAPRTRLPWPQDFQQAGGIVRSLGARYLLGPPELVRYARLSAGVMRLIDPSAVLWMEFADALLPGFKSRYNDFRRQQRNDVKWADLDRLRSTGSGTHEEGIDRVTGGLPDFAPYVIRRLAAREVDSDGITRHQDGPQSSADRVRLHRLRKRESVWPGILNGIEAAAREVAWCSHSPTRKATKLRQSERNPYRYDRLHNRMRGQYRLQDKQVRDDVLLRLRALERNPDAIYDPTDEPLRHFEATRPRAAPLSPYDGWSQDVLLGVGASSAKRADRVYSSDGRLYRVMPHQDVRPPVAISGVGGDGV